MNVFQTNRARISLDELKQYDGQWVAFSIDGRRILAGAADLIELDQQLVAAGIDPEKAAFEWIELENGDSRIGGAEFL